MRKHLGSRGFTLTELTIILVVIGALALLATSNYFNSVKNYRIKAASAKYPNNEEEVVEGVIKETGRIIFFVRKRENDFSVSRWIYDNDYSPWYSSWEFVVCFTQKVVFLDSIEGRVHKKLLMNDRLIQQLLKQSLRPAERQETVGGEECEVFQY